MKFDEYAKVVPVRNLYSLVVSLFTYGQFDVSGTPWWHRSKDESFIPISFTDWLESEDTFNMLFEKHRLVEYIFDEGENLSDFCFDTTLQDNEFRSFMLGRCGLDLFDKEIPSLNATKKSISLIEEVKLCYSSKITKEMFN